MSCVRTSVSLSSCDCTTQPSPRGPLRLHGIQRSARWPHVTPPDLALRAAGPDSPMRAEAGPVDLLRVLPGAVVTSDVGPVAAEIPAYVTRTGAPAAPANGPVAARPSTRRVARAAWRPCPTAVAVTARTRGIRATVAAIGASVRTPIRRIGTAVRGVRALGGV